MEVFVEIVIHVGSTLLALWLFMVVTEPDEDDDDHPCPRCGS